MPAKKLPKIGDRGCLTGDHPWAGHHGTVVEIGSWLGNPAVVIKLDDSNDVPPGHKAGLTNARNWRPETPQPKDAE